MFYKRLPLMVLCCFLGIGQAQAIDLSDMPLDVQLNAAQPVLMLILDNSSDMLAEYLTEEPDGLFEQHRYLFAPADISPDHGTGSGQERVLPESKRRLWKSQWHGYNSVFYAPHTDYPPWTGVSNLAFGQADIQRPCYDPAQCSSDSRRLLLAQPFMHVYDGQRRYAVANAHYFTVYDANRNGRFDRSDPVYLVTWNDEDEDNLLDVTGHADEDRRLYFLYQDDGDGVLEDQEVSLVTNPEEKNRIKPAVYDALGGFQRYKTDLEDLQNFANWFSYYRSRALCLKAAVGSVLASADRVRVGIYAVNGQPRTAASGEEDSSADGNDNLRAQVYHMKFSDGSSLRGALDAIGRYYHQTLSSSLGQSPYAREEQGGGCQSAHVLILTGGRDDGSFSGLGNADGDKGSPYADAWSDTLADVAMHYYETDLAPQLVDAYAGYGCDTALHQHLVTHAISFGPSGTIDPDDIDGDGNIDSPSYRQDPCFRGQGIPKPEWPQPLPGTPSLVDDVWHAAVNGRGRYCHAKNPAELARRLEEIIARIQTSAQVRAADFTSGFAEESSVLVQSSYSSEDWSGNLIAYRFDPTQGAAGAAMGDMLWQASTGLAGAMSGLNARRIVSYGGFWRHPQGIPFQYESLSDAQRMALGSDLAHDSELDRSARDVLAYLRGADNAQFRPRDSLLGDVVHAAPLIAGRTVFCGANDGMMHAFALEDGRERFAYVPHLVFHRLAALGQYDYLDNHRFYVDGPLSAGEVLVGAYQRSTFLVGGLGRGGKGYYCLRLNQRHRTREGSVYGGYTTTFTIDDVNSSSTENEISAIVLWEYPQPRPDDDGMDNNGNGLTDETGESDPDIGFSYPRAYA
ncbi:MAG: PilC/PilY family type IV pilus protein, partial [Desulfosarcinaceae bacterium]